MVTSAIRSLVYKHKGDVLIHAGDFAQRCEDDSHIIEFNNWIKSQPFSYKIVIAGYALFV